MKVSPDSAADLIARLLKRRGVKRVFALCGGHIMPIWMRLDAEGIRIIDVRDERAAVHMAQAHAELTGELGVALVTAGPGMTNAITGIANAHVSRAPVLVLSGGNPRPQENRGGLQDMDHTQLVRSITRYARTVREPSLVLQELDEAISRAFGEGGEPGPAYIDFPTDTLRGIVPKALQLEEHLNAKPRTVTRPDPAAGRARRRSPVVGAPRAGHFRSRRPRRRTRTGLAARSAWRGLSRYRRKPRPGAGQPSIRRRRHARRGHERCRRDPHRWPAPRLPARVRIASGISRRKIRPHRRYTVGNAGQPARRRGDPRLSRRNPSRDRRTCRQSRVQGRPAMGREAARRTRGARQEAAADHGERAERHRRPAASEQGAVGACSRPSATTRS